MPELSDAFGPARAPWRQLLRARTVPALIAPAIVGAAFARHRTGSFSWGWFIVTVAGAAAAVLSLNVVFDVVDDASGAHASARADGLSVPTGSDAIAFGGISRAGATRVAVVFAAAALAAGVAIAAGRDGAAFAIGVAGYVLVLAAAVPPVRLATRSAFAGEMIVFAAGIAEGVAAYGAQARRVDGAAFAGAVVPGLLLVLVAFHQSFARHRADRDVSRPSTVSRLGAFRALTASMVLAAATLGALVWESIAGVLPAWSALAVVGWLPLFGAYRAMLTEPEMLDHQLTLLGASVGASILVDAILTIVLAVRR